MNKFDRIERILLDCYRELYAKSIGRDGKAGDFDKLMETATMNELGQKIIPYDDYYIPKEDFEGIVEKYKQKVPKLYQRQFGATIYLGASPTCNKENWEKKDD